MSYVAELLFFPDADRKLALLQADFGRRQLYDRINDLLDVLEADPGDASVDGSATNAADLGDTCLWIRRGMDHPLE